MCARACVCTYIYIYIYTFLKPPGHLEASGRRFWSHMPHWRSILHNFSACLASISTYFRVNFEAQRLLVFIFLLFAVAFRFILDPKYTSNAQSTSEIITYTCKYQRRPGGMRGAFEYIYIYTHIQHRPIHTM